MTARNTFSQENDLDTQLHEFRR